MDGWQAAYKYLQCQKGLNQLSETQKVAQEKIYQNLTQNWNFKSNLHQIYRKYNVNIVNVENN